MRLIQTVRVTTSGITTLGFSNIPMTGYDLMVLFSLKDTTTGNFNDVFMTFATTSGAAADYSYVSIRNSIGGIGPASEVRNSGTGFVSSWNFRVPGSDSGNSGAFGVGSLLITDYQNAFGDWNAGILDTGVGSDTPSNIFSHVAAQTAGRVTDITVGTGNNWAIGSSMSLYTIPRT